MELRNWVEYKQYLELQEWVWYIDDYVNLWAYIIYWICIILLINFIYKNYKNNEKRSILISWIIFRLLILFIIFIVFSGIDLYLNCLCIF